MPNKVISWKNSIQTENGNKREKIKEREETGRNIKFRMMQQERGENIEK